MSKIIRFDGKLLQRTVNSITKKSELSGVPWLRFHELNSILKGFRPGELSILSGRTGIGKTTFMCEYSLDLCERGVPTLWGSFEMPIHKICGVMLRQFAGESLDGVNDKVLNNWSDAFSSLPFYFFDMYGAQSSNKVLSEAVECVEKYKIQHLIIDNIQFMLGASDSTFQERFTRQDKFIQDLRKFCSVYNCHTTVVIHPRKDDVKQLLSVNSLYGGGKVSQEADNIMLLQTEPNSSFPKKFVQIVKNRYDGTLGSLDLRFNRERSSYRPLKRQFTNYASNSQLLFDTEGEKEGDQVQ